MAYSIDLIRYRHIYDINTDVDEDVDIDLDIDTMIQMLI